MSADDGRILQMIPESLDVDVFILNSGGEETVGFIGVLLEKTWIVLFLPPRVEFDY